MIVRLFSLLMAFTLLISAASANANTGLKAAFDELQYSLSIEWDQQDKKFYDAQMQTFMDKVSKLQVDGLTNTEIISFVKSQVKDQAAAKDIETALNYINLKKMTQAEATQFMLETMKRSYSHGSSWSWEWSATAISVAIVVGFVLLIVFSGNQDSGTTTTTTNGAGPICSQQYQCQPFCYNDAVYGYTCQQQCFWTSYCY